MIYTYCADIKELPKRTLYCIAPLIPETGVASAVFAGFLSQFLIPLFGEQVPLNGIVPQEAGMGG